MSQADETEPTLSPAEEAELLGLLEAALRPMALDPVTNDHLIALCLDDPLAPPSAEELTQAARLRDALADGSPNDEADMLRALAAPFAPSGEHAAERALTAALERSPAPAIKPRRNVVYVLFGASSALLAAAAAVALLVAPSAQRSAPTAALAPPAPALVKPHSTVDLFEQPFETGATSARIDLIASARSRDLRDNRYAAWGIR